MTDQPRHFLNLDDFDATTLRGMLNQAVELKEPAQEGRQAADPQGQGPRDDLRAPVDPHPRLLRCRHAPARRRDHHADRRRNAAVARRDAGGHRARDVALCRCDHDPHPDPRRPARAGGGFDRAGDQRPHPPGASLPGDGRRHDLRGAQGADQGRQDRLGRRQQQRARLVGERRGTLRGQPHDRRAGRLLRRKRTSSPTSGRPAPRSR